MEFYTSLLDFSFEWESSIEEASELLVDFPVITLGIGKVIIPADYDWENDLWVIYEVLLSCGIVMDWREATV